MYQGAMAMKGCIAFTKVPASLEPHHHRLFSVISKTHDGGCYSSAEMKSVNSTATADWAIVDLGVMEITTHCTQTRLPELEN